MSTIRLFTDQELKKDKIIPLTLSQQHYLKNVMRKKEGDSLFLFNGKDGEYQGNLIEEKKNFSVQLIHQSKKQPVKKGPLELIFPFIKPKRLEFLIEKATELGVDIFQPIQTDYTSTPHINIEKMKSWAIEAAEQSQRLTVPQFSPLLPLKEVIAERETSFLYYLDERKESPLINQIEFHSSSSFIIGPEGGFSKKEFLLFKENNIKGVTLTDLTLRTETAAITALSYYKCQRKTSI